MSKTLEVSESHIEVDCPKCGHKWWTELALGWNKRFNDNIIRCPECSAPLKRPTYDPDESNPLMHPNRIKVE